MRKFMVYNEFTMAQGFLKRSLPSRAEFDRLIDGDLHPMVFVTGPRQVGKTFLCRRYFDSYFNWDTVEVKKAFLKDPYFFRSQNKAVIFDEIHKRKDWKKLLKGYFDSPSRQENFVITGSGRFDQYQRGGDSLQGRYLSYSLWPLSYGEVYGGAPILAEPRNWVQWQPDSSALSDSDLIALGGFPEPFLRGNKNSLNRWQDLYLDRLVREDVRDFSAVQRLDQMELLARLMRQRVGNTISILNLSQDVEASQVAVKHWLRLFETLYLGFQMKPFHSKIHRAVKKEKKWFFYQWTFAEDEAAAFENYIAVQLSAAFSAWNEQGHGVWELYYLRDQDRREVDFVGVHNLKPKFLVEAKLSEQSWPVSLKYYQKKLNIPAFLVYKTGSVKRIENSGWSLPSHSFLKGLS